MKFERICNTKTISGYIGIACLFSKDLGVAANDILDTIGRQQFMWCSNTPHVSLFHTNVDHADISFIKELIMPIHSIIGRYLTFNKINVFGGKFLFWNVGNASILKDAHEQSLLLSKYRTLGVSTKASEEQLFLSKAQIDNLDAYGYPLVKSEFLPHITLSYSSKDISPCLILKVRKEYRAIIERVEVVRIGKYGAIDSILNFE